MNLNRGFSALLRSERVILLFERKICRGKYGCLACFLIVSGNLIYILRSGCEFLQSGRILVGINTSEFVGFPS